MLCFQMPQWMKQSITYRKQASIKEWCENSPFQRLKIQKIYIKNLMKQCIALYCIWIHNEIKNCYPQTLKYSKSPLYLIYNKKYEINMVLHFWYNYISFYSYPIWISSCFYNLDWLDRGLMLLQLCSRRP